MSSSSHFFSPSDFVWLNLLVLEAQGTRLLRSLDRLVSMRRLCRMLWGCLRDRKQRLLTVRPLPPPPTPPSRLHKSNEGTSCKSSNFASYSSPSEDVTGTVSTGIINQHVIDYSGVCFLVFCQPDTSSYYLRRWPLSWENAPIKLAIGKPVVRFLDWQLMWKGPAHCR